MQPSRFGVDPVPELRPLVPGAVLVLDGQSSEGVAGGQNDPVAGFGGGGGSGGDQQGEGGAGGGETGARR